MGRRALAQYEAGVRVLDDQNRMLVVEVAVVCSTGSSLCVVRSETGTSAPVLVRIGTRRFFRRLAP